MALGQSLHFPWGGCGSHGEAWFRFLSLRWLSSSALKEWNPAVFGSMWWWRGLLWALVHFGGSNSCLGLRASSRGDREWACVWPKRAAPSGSGHPLQPLWLVRDECCLQWGWPGSPPSPLPLRLWVISRGVGSAGRWVQPRGCGLSLGRGLVACRSWGPAVLRGLCWEPISIEKNNSSILVSLAIFSPDNWQAPGCSRHYLSIYPSSW